MIWERLTEALDDIFNKQKTKFRQSVCCNKEFANED